MKDIIDKLIERAQSDYDRYKDLPLSVYVTSVNGDIVLYNDNTQKMFCFDDTKSKTNFNVNDYYFTPKRRERILKKMKSISNNNWQVNQSLTFKVDKKRLSVNFFCKVYKEKEDLLGSICFVSQTNGFEKYKPLENGLPVGLFEISKENEVTESNRTFREILGIPENWDKKIDIIKYLSADKNLDENAEDYALRKNIYASLIKELVNVGFINNRVVPVKKHDGSNIIAKINLTVEEKLDNRIYKAKGLIEDISFRAILEDIQKLNIALFMLEKNAKGNLIICHINEYFKKLFLIPENESCIGWNFRKLPFSVDEQDNILSTISNTRKETLDLKVKSRASSESSVELSLHIKKIDEEGNRYVGAFYTDRGEVERAIKDTRNNFSSFLHSYSAMANNIKDTLQGIIDAHGTNAVEDDGRVNRELTFRSIQSHINGFKKIIKRFEKEIKEKRLAPFDFSQITFHINNIESDEVDYAAISMASSGAIRSNFVGIREAIESYKDLSNISKETLKSLRSEIMQVLRFSRLLTINYLENEAFEMTLEVDAFKDILKSRSLVSKNETFNLRESLDRSLNFLHSFADRRNINLMKHYDNKFNGGVVGNERNLFTVFYNVIHNAIKYSFIKPNSKTSTVHIRIIESLTEFNIIVENRGVGIGEEEILSGNLFKFGSRGAGAKDRNRTGHGVGLWHSNNIMHQFKGGIKIDSEPIGYTLLERNQPHITTVTLTIPKPNTK